MRLLEIGGGIRRHPLAYASLDIRHPHNSRPIDLGVDTWPVDDGSVDSLYASHVLEHIAKGEPIFHVMAEAHRVLRPGGTFAIKVPVIGYAGCTALVTDFRTYAEPTHLQFIWMPQTFEFFCEGCDYSDGFVEYDIPRFAPMGPYFDQQSAYETMDAVGGPDHSWEPFWSVGDGWEGLCQLVRP